MRPERMPIAVYGTPFAPSTNIFRKFGLNASTCGKNSVGPPIEKMAMVGTASTQKNIRMPWKKSVQHTAKKPPAKVYEITTTAPMTSETRYGMPNTDENSFAQDTKPEAV